MGCKTMQVPSKERGRFPQINGATQVGEKGTQLWENMPMESGIIINATKLDGNGIHMKTLRCPMHRTRLWKGMGVPPPHFHLRGLFNDVGVLGGSKVLGYCELIFEMSIGGTMEILGYIEEK